MILYVAHLINEPHILFRKATLYKNSAYDI